MSAYCIEQLDPILDWTMVTRVNYVTFMHTILPVYNGTVPALVPPPLSKPKSPTFVVPNFLTDPLKEFKKGIKHDPTQFPMLSDFKNWDSFFHLFMIEAKAQGLNNAIDPAYHPRTDEDKALFECQNEFMLLVFNMKLKTDKAKEAICQHCKSEYVAQKIFADVKAHAKQGTAAKIDSRHILKYLTTIRWGSPTLRWTSGAEAFVCHYKDKLLTYTESKGGGPFLPDVKIVMFQNVVSTLPELAAVQHMDELLCTCIGDSLDFNKYFDLLISMAAHYDETSAGSAGKIKGHAVYTHELSPDDDADGDNDPYMTIDSPIDSIQVFQTDRAPSSHGRNLCGHRPPLTRLPFVAWKQLTPEQQALWDQLPNKAKEIILSTTKSWNSSDDQTANLHDKSAQD